MCLCSMLPRGGRTSVPFRVSLPATMMLQKISSQGKQAHTIDGACPNLWYKGIIRLKPTPGAPLFYEKPHLTFGCQSLTLSLLVCVCNSLRLCWCALLPWMRVALATWAGPDVPASYRAHLCDSSQSIEISSRSIAICRKTKGTHSGICSSSATAPLVVGQKC